MPQDRQGSIYQLQTKSELGAIRKIESLRLLSDEAACRYARLVIEHDSIEIWRHGRKLVVLEAEPSRLKFSVVRRRKPSFAATACRLGGESNGTRRIVLAPNEKAAC